MSTEKEAPTAGEETTNTPDVPVGSFVQALGRASARLTTLEAANADLRAQLEAEAAKAKEWHDKLIDAAAAQERIAEYARKLVAHEASKRTELESARDAALARVAEVEAKLAAAEAECVERRRALDLKARQYESACRGVSRNADKAIEWFKERDTARHRLATLEKLAGELIAALPRCMATFDESRCKKPMTAQSLWGRFCDEHARERPRNSDDGLRDISYGTQLRMLSAFLASDSAAGEPRQGVAESAALFSPEMVEAINEIRFGRCTALEYMHNLFEVSDGQLTDLALTREQAIRRAFELSRGEKGGRG